VSHRRVALLAAFLRLVHAVVFAATALTAYGVLLLVGQDAIGTGLAPEVRNTLALVLLEAHGFGYVIALVLASRAMPHLIGILLLAAGVGYLTDSVAQTLLSDYAAHEAVFGVLVFLPAVIGELAFAVWLVVKGAFGR
jgi:hypothetical protein